jgi:hypothetical protein
MGVITDMSVKQKLDAILRQTDLTPKERELYTSIWDAFHRYKRITHKQSAVIDKIFFGKNLDKATVAKKVGAIRVPGVTAGFTVVTLSQFKAKCPQAEGNKCMMSKVLAFFEGGGTQLQVSPEETAK